MKKINNILSNKFILLAGLSVAAFTLQSCENKTDFKTGSKVKRLTKSDTSSADALGSDKSYSDLIGGDGLILTTALATSAAENSVWTVTSDGNVTQILLDKEAGYPTKHWSGTGGGGHRTYVTKIGLIIGTTGGDIYRAGGDVPEGPAQHITKLAANRICLTSYKIGSTEYIGAGYDTGGTRKFTAIPIDTTMPKKVDLSKAQTYDVGSGSWGYSCTTDQARKYFWSKDNSTGGNISGVDLRTGKAIGPEKMPNFNQVNTTGATLNLKNSEQSYSMSTDLLGNILSFSNGYTAAHETLSDTIFVTQMSSNNLVVMKGDCVRNKACGASDSYQFDLSGYSYVRPLSSLNDGRVVGLSRGGTSDVSLISLKDPKDISKGVDIEVIKTIPGNAYMYADFTGATIYASTEIKPLDLKTADGFDATKPVKQIYLKWQSESGFAEEWRGLLASIRCYSAANEAEVAHERVSNMPVAGDPMKVKAESCNGKMFDTVEIKVQPDGSSIFSKTKQFEIVIEQ